MSNQKSFGVPPETPLRTTGGTRTTGWEPLVYTIQSSETAYFQDEMINYT